MKNSAKNKRKKIEKERQRSRERERGREHYENFKKQKKNNGIRKKKEIYMSEGKGF